MVQRIGKLAACNFLLHKAGKGCALVINMAAAIDAFVFCDVLLCDMKI